MKNKQKIRLFHGLARCGGTVINRCIGSMDKTVVLSEINPRFNIEQLLSQSDEWFNLIGDIDKRIFKGTSRINNNFAFRFLITKLLQRCEKSEKTLIIRDWNHPDFIGYPYDDKPTGTSSSLQALEKHFSCISVAVVRHPIDQYLSSIKREGLRALEIDLFLKGYRNFADFASRRKYMRFEDFSENPNLSLKDFCGALETQYDDKWIDKWHSYWKVTGDNDQPDRSRGVHSQSILPLKRTQFSAELQKRFEANPDYQKSMELLGYQ
jgi:hypothetical protein